MAWLVVDKDGWEKICDTKPFRKRDSYWDCDWDNGGSPISMIAVREGTIEEILGFKLTWENEPEEIWAL